MRASAVVVASCGKKQSAADPMSRADTYFMDDVRGLRARTTTFTSSTANGGVRKRRCTLTSGGCFDSQSGGAGLGRNINALDDCLTDLRSRN